MGRSITDPSGITVKSVYIGIMNSVVNIAGVRNIDPIVIVKINLR
jgi:hypothetical protein